MKVNYSSKEEIFEKAKEIVYRDGLTSLSMRKLANECFLALGTLYHYFSSKEDLVVYIIEDFWKTHFASCYGLDSRDDFKTTFRSFYETAKKAYGEFETTFSDVRIVGAKSLLIKGKETQKKFLERLKDYLCHIALNDANVKHEVFNDDFTLEEFVSTLLDIVILSLVNHTEIEKFILALITKTMY